MIAMLRTLSGLFTFAYVQGREHGLREDFSRPMLGHDPGASSDAFYGIERSISYRRPFAREKAWKVVCPHAVIRPARSTTEDHWEIYVGQFDEKLDPNMPLEILSRRFEEAEREWLAAGERLQALKAEMDRRSR